MTNKSICAVAFATSISLSAASIVDANLRRRTAHLRTLRRTFTELDQRKLHHNTVQDSPEGKTPRNILCLDDSSYRTKIGVSCKAIRQANLTCDGFLEIGFSPAEIGELKRSCPNACGLCTDAATAKLFSSLTATPTTNPTVSPTLSAAPSITPTITPTIAPTVTPTATPTTTPPTEAPTITPTVTPTAAPTTCFDGSCADDPMYLLGTPLNIDCNTIRAGSLDCKKFGVLHYDDDEVAELIAKCPCACNVQCKVSDAPSGMPTLVPSNEPSAEPSAAPSAKPSVAPSAKPSVAPSSSPSISHLASPSGADKRTDLNSEVNDILETNEAIEDEVHINEFNVPMNQELHPTNNGSGNQIHAVTIASCVVLHAISSVVIEIILN